MLSTDLQQHMPFRTLTLNPCTENSWQFSGAHEAVSVARLDHRVVLGTFSHIEAETSVHSYITDEPELCCCPKHSSPTL
jgi:hypothetical protein